MYHQSALLRALYWSRDQSSLLTQWPDKALKCKFPLLLLHNCLAKYLRLSRNLPLLLDEARPEHPRGKADIAQ